jgi:hypothetical protein
MIPAGVIKAVLAAEAADSWTNRKAPLMHRRCWWQVPIWIAATLFMLALFRYKHAFEIFEPFRGQVSFRLYSLINEVAGLALLIAAAATTWLAARLSRRVAASCQQRRWRPLIRSFAVCALISCIGIRAMSIIQQPLTETEDIGVVQEVVDGGIRFEIELLPPIQEILTDWKYYARKHNLLFVLPEFWRPQYQPPSHAPDRIVVPTELLRQRVLAPTRHRVFVWLETDDSVSDEYWGRRKSERGPDRTVWYVPEQFVDGILGKIGTGPWITPLHARAVGERSLKAGGIGDFYVEAEFPVSYSVSQQRIEPFSIRIAATPSGNPVIAHFQLPIDLRQEVANRRRQTGKIDEHQRQRLLRRPDSVFLPHDVLEAIPDYDLMIFPPKPRLAPVGGHWATVKQWLDLGTVVIYAGAAVTWVATLSPLFRRRPSSGIVQ